jgi:V8-like Glu-specific endopeptidase
MKGTLSDALDEKTLAGNYQLAPFNAKVPHTPRTRRLANQKNTPLPHAESSGFNDDQRVRVVNPRAYPFSTVCAIASFFDDGDPRGGTGFLIGPRLVLTAGHNVCYQGQPVKRALILPGLNGDYSSVPHLESVQWLSVDAWARDQNTNYDYGALVLDSDLGVQRGWLSVETRADGDLPTGLAINTAGYPADCPAAAAGECGEPSTTMWWDAGSVSKIDDFKIYYANLKMYDGDSGSPIFVYEPGSQDPYRAIGIHTYLWSLSYSATRINAWAYQIIGGWLQQYSPIPSTT